MTAQTSYRTILRTSLITGSATVLKISTGLVKMKVAAVLLGPVGIGLIGLYMKLMTTAATIAMLGVRSSGTRQVAAAQDDGGDAAVWEVRHALFWGALVLAVLGGVVFLLARDVIADLVVQAPDRRGDLVWLAIGVAAAVLTAYHGAVLTGLRRIGDLATLQVLAGVLSTLLGILAIWAWGSDGIVIMVISVPLISLVLGYGFLVRLRTPRGPFPSRAAMQRQWWMAASLGFAFMASNAFCMTGELVIRAMVQNELGLGGLGQFQAAWSVGITYLGFLFTAMGTDFYPRLTAAIGSPDDANRMVNEQAEVALLICAPLLLLLLSLAPWVIRLLYTEEFLLVVDVLRIQLLSDVLRVMCWPLTVTLMAAGAGRMYFAAESISTVVLLGIFWVGLPILGLQATGLSYLILFALYLPALMVILRRRMGFAWSRQVILQAVALFVTASALFALSSWSEGWTATLGCLAALAFGVYGLIHLSHMAGLEGRVGRIAQKSRRILNRVGLR